MKNLFIAFLFCSSFVFSQDLAQKKWGFEVSAKFGNGKLYQDNVAPVNGSYSAGDFLLHYRFHKNFGVKTGLTLAEYNANFVAGGNTLNIKNSYAHIPLKLQYTTGLFKRQSPEDVNINMIFGIGAQANTLYKSELESGSDTEKEKNLGWNFASNFDWGLEFGFARNMSMGVIYEAMTDFTDLDANGTYQRLKSVNTIKITYTLDF
jgi:hypothetical protein